MPRLGNETYIHCDSCFARAKTMRGDWKADLERRILCAKCGGEDMSNAGFSYVGKRACGCIRMAMVEELSTKKEIGEFCADALKRGYKVERVLLDDPQLHFGECDQCRQPTQRGLFAEAA